jgi:hypothetical protein
LWRSSSTSRYGTKILNTRVRTSGIVEVKFKIKVWD